MKKGTKIEMRGMTIIPQFCVCVYDQKNLFKAGLLSCLNPTVEQIIVHWLSVPRVQGTMLIPREDSNYMEDSKHHHCAAYQEQKSKHFCPLHLGIRVTKQVTTQSSTGWNSTLLTQQRDRAISASVVVVGPPWPADLSRCPMHGSLPMHTPLQLQWKEPHPLPNEDRYSNGLSRCRHTLLKERSKTTY